MKNGFMLFMACAITIAVAASQDDEMKSKPSADLTPAQEFSVGNTTTLHPKPTTHHPNTTTPHPKPTTHHPNTTTPHPNTTTHHPKPTTHHPNTTTHHPNTTTHHPKPTTHHPNTTTPHPKPTTHHPNTTTPHPKPTTHHPNTTTPHPKPTTHHPNTTTPHPKPTTHHPNTTTPHPKPTTHHPNTTTHAPPPPPPPQPTPKANLTVGNYTLRNGKSVCALATMALQIRVQYGPTNKQEGTYILQSAKTNVTGKCENSIVNFNITFKEGFIDLHFQKNLTEKSVYVSSVAVELNYPFPAATKTKFTASNNTVKLFLAAIGHSYSCKSQSVYLGQGLYLDMTKGRMQAFNITNINSFGPPDPCPADKPDYRAAIAVGVVLLILIIIVVVAYIIGRRKRTGGYQTL
ncbi:hypothetical protein SKAU_G00371260 [Synaphobranchus kaupii]|uniref:Uncharacterized protein n=1 Tax=Synaphobranchus kaupii TaxID=118154 RepID=A0A9Q1IF08_SYNKA|nr:hypothetical protein SKAU_G00371260 [Synaphobranchus kaupii]